MNVIYLHAFNKIKLQLALLKNPSVSLLRLPLVLSSQTSVDKMSWIHISCRVNPHYSCVSLQRDTIGSVQAKSRVRHKVHLFHENFNFEMKRTFSTGTFLAYLVNCGLPTAQCLHFSLPPQYFHCRLVLFNLCIQNIFLQKT